MIAECIGCPIGLLVGKKPGKPHYGSLDEGGKDALRSDLIELCRGITRL